MPLRRLDDLAARPAPARRRRARRDAAARHGPGRRCADASSDTSAPARRGADGRTRGRDRVRSVMTSMPRRDEGVDDACRPPSRCPGWRARRRSPGRPATARCRDARRRRCARARRGARPASRSAAPRPCRAGSSRRRRAAGIPARRRDSRIRGATSTTRSMARPTTHDLAAACLGRRRPRRAMRATFEAKVVTATRCGAAAMSSASRFATSLSLGLRPVADDVRGIADERQHALVAEGAERRLGRRCCRDTACRRASSRRYAGRARAACGWRARSIPGSNARRERTRCRTGPSARRWPGATSCSGDLGRARLGEPARLEKADGEARRVDRRAAGAATARRARRCDPRAHG